MLMKLLKNIYIFYVKKAPTIKLFLYRIPSKKVGILLAIFKKTHHNTMSDVPSFPKNVIIYLFFWK